MESIAPFLKGALIAGAVGVLFGCSAGQQAVPATPNAAARPVQTRALARSSPLLYALEEYNDSVTGYPVTANGNVSPTWTLEGGATKIYEPAGMAIARSGEIALADANNELTLYPPGASGNTPPSATITCGGLQNQPGVPSEMAFDAQGNLYVLFFLGHFEQSDEIEVFTPSEQQSGCQYGDAIYGSQTGIAEFGGLAVSGKLVYQASGDSVRGFSVTANGNVPPSVLIEGAKTGLETANAVSFDARGRIYVSEDNDVRVFSAHAHGNAKPIAVIAGYLTQIPDTQDGQATGLIVSKDGTMYVAVQNDGTDSILVFAPGANGNVAPRQVISGSNTELSFVQVLGLKE